MSLDHSKRWRMTATYQDGSTKTVAYKTERAARESAKFEESLSMTKRTRVWRKDHDWDGIV